MARDMKRIALLLTTIVAVLIALPLMVYLPPVQQWLTQKATHMAAEATGMDISIGSVALRFPLTLSLADVKVADGDEQHTDTIALIRRLDASLELLPLFSLRAELGGLTISDARLNTLCLISDTQICGTVGRLDIGPATVHIDKGTADVTALLIADTRLTVLLSDTAAVDTTESKPLPWHIALHKATLSNVDCKVHLPGDSIIAAATLAKAVATGADIDLLHGRYAVATLDISESAMAYDQPYVPHAQPATGGKSMDYAHLSCNGLALNADSIVCQPPALTLAIRHAALKEQCGLQLNDLTAGVAIDSLGINVDALALHTPSSSLFAQGRLAYASLDTRQDTGNGGTSRNNDGSTANSSISLEASLSKHDLAHFYPLEALPDWPIAIKAKAAGNIVHADIEQLIVDCPTLLHAEAQGYVGREDSTAIAADMTLRLTAHNATPLLKAIADDATAWRIPQGLQLNAALKSATGIYDADIAVTYAKATLTAKAMADTKADAYNASADIRGINVDDFMPGTSATIHQASIEAQGHGYDLFDKRTFLNATANIDSMTYQQWRTDSVALSATLDEGHLTATIGSHNSIAEGTVDIGMDIDQQGEGKKTKTKNIKTQLALDIARLDLHALGIADHRLETGMKGDVSMETNLSDKHRLSGLLKDLTLTDSVKTHHPENLGLLLVLRTDTTYARVQNGNFIVKLDAPGEYKELLAKLTALADTIQRQTDNQIIDQARLKQMLPVMRLYVTSGKDNAPANILRAAKGIDFKEMLADISASPEEGLNGQMHIHRLQMGTTRIDTINATLKDSNHGLTYQARIANEKKNPLMFTALLDGHLYEHGARVGLRIFDKNGAQGLRMGAQAYMEDEGIRLTLLPKKPTLAFREFTLNDDNYIFVRKDMRLNAKVEMEDDDGTTIDIYSEEENDSTRLQDFTVSLAKVDLKRISDILPFIPKMEGTFNGDFHVIMDNRQQISVATDADVDNMVYEGNSMGNIDTEFVYLQDNDNTHTVDGILAHNGRQVASVEGKYSNKKNTNANGQLDALLTLVNTPLNLANGFITDNILGMQGYANGQLALKGPLNAIIADGSLQLDSAILYSIPYGISMGVDRQPINIKQSKLTLSNFKLYARPEMQEKDLLATTLNLMNKAIRATQETADTTAYITINGNADFGTEGPATLDFRLRANELLLVNAKQQAGSLLYGKGFISIMAMLRGTTEKMTVRGRLNVLGKTDITYLLLDSPLSTDNQMDELVRFTDFSDSTVTTRLTPPKPANIDLNLNVNIDQGAHIRCGLNAGQTNYVDIFGGGELRMKMTDSEELSLTGRYTINNGTMKYSLPVIPLKTFTIQDGSYVEFTGTPNNPTLNITATERTRATVGQEGQESRSVTFDCGVVVTKTLNDMGLQFTIAAPEDITLQSELQAMTVEQRGKLAVTMLTTGMYLADGNTAGFSMNSALSSFLQSEINNIAGNALSTLDISMGVDNTTDASGNMHTDYSFQFAKRFWNNRLKVQIGGKVSSGQEAQGQNQSFFDNVSMEYRVTPTSNQYLKLFYKQNVYDWLDGYTGEYGAGYIYKRKMDHWWDIFSLWKKDEKQRERQR